MNVIFTPKNINDVNVYRFHRAIINKAEAMGITTQTMVVSNQYELDEVVKLDKFIVMEPCEFQYNKDNPNNLERNLTAGVVADLCNGIRNEDSKANTVLILNRSELIGKALASRLLDNDFSVMIVHSKTPLQALKKALGIADIVVLATGTDLSYLTFMNLKDKHVVDISNDYKSKKHICKSYHGMSEIGKKTVQALLELVEVR